MGFTHFSDEPGKDFNEIDNIAIRGQTVQTSTIVTINMYNFLSCVYILLYNKVIKKNSDKKIKINFM